MRYNWDNVPKFKEIYNSVLTKSDFYIKDSEVLKEYMNYLEDFIYSCINRRLITTNNVDMIMDRLSRLEYISFMLDIDNAKGYTSKKRDHVFIKKDLKGDDRRLYFYNELVKVITSLDLDEVREKAFEDCSEKRFNSKEEGYTYYGWEMIRDAICQEISEIAFFDSLKKGRPRFEEVTDPELLGNITFKSNAIHHPIYQYLLLQFYKSLNINSVVEKNDVDVLNKICKNAFNENFTMELFKEYVDLYGSKDVHKLIGKLGVLASKRAANTNEKLLADRSIDEKYAVKTYKSVNRVLNSRIKKSKRFI